MLPNDSKTPHNFLIIGLIEEISENEDNEKAVIEYLDSYYKIMVDCNEENKPITFDDLFSFCLESSDFWCQFDWFLNLDKNELEDSIKFKAYIEEICYWLFQ